MTVSDTVPFMSSAKIVISLDPETLRQVDRIVESGLFPSRDRLIQDAVTEKHAPSSSLRLKEPRLKNSFKAKSLKLNRETIARLGSEELTGAKGAAADAEKCTGCPSGCGIFPDEQVVTA